MSRPSARSSAPEPARRCNRGSLCAYAFALAALLALFGLLAAEAVTGLLLGAEADALGDLHTESPPALDSAMRFASAVGRGRPLSAITAVIVGLLALRRRWRDAALVALAMSGAALNPPLKLLFDRPRPQLWSAAATFDGSSFPSGHAMSSATFVAALVALAWPTR